MTMKRFWLVAAICGWCLAGGVAVYELIRWLR